MDPLAALLARWREEAETLARCGHEAHAGDLERRIEALEDALRRREQEAWMDTEAAASFSGYSRDRLRRLAKEEEVVAKKEGGAWRFLRSSLPRKPGRDLQQRRERPSVRAARRALVKTSN